MARAMLTPRLLRAIASARAGFSTSSGTMAWKAGALSAAPRPMTAVSDSSTSGVVCPRAVEVARPAAPSRISTCEASSSLRRSTTSARAPPGRAKRNIGKVVAAWTIATHKGLGDSEVISHEAPTSFIQVPMFETMVAIHRARNSGVARGARAVLVCVWGGEAVMEETFGKSGPSCQGRVRQP